MTAETDWVFINPKHPSAPRIRIYDGSPTPAGMITIRLIEVAPNEIMLAAVDDLGECILDAESDAHAGSILTITDRHVVMCVNVMPTLGFELDVNGCVAPDPELEALKAKRSKNFGGKRAAFRVIE